MLMKLKRQTTVNWMTSYVVFVYSLLLEVGATMRMAVDAYVWQTLESVHGCVFGASGSA